MMKKLKKFFSKPQNVGIGILGFLLIVGAIFALMKILSPDEPAILEGQIKVERGGKIITINQNGLVEYRSEDGVFYETWSPSKTQAFFTIMEAKARTYLANKSDVIPENSYKVTLWIDGEIVVIYVAIDDEDLEELFEEFDNQDDGEDVSDYFDEDEGTGDGSGSSGGVSPTPTSAAVGGGPTPTSPPAEGNDGTGEQSVADCDLYGSNVTQRTVISNTICQIEEE